MSDRLPTWNGRVIRQGSKERPKVPAPVLGNLDSVTELAREGRHRVVAACATLVRTSRRMRQFSWSLKGQATAKLAFHPGLIQVTGLRLHVDLVDRLPCCR